MSPREVTPPNAPTPTVEGIGSITHHTAIGGSPGAGATSLAARIAHAATQGGHRVTVWNPYGDLDVWAPTGANVVFGESLLEPVGNTLPGFLRDTIRDLQETPATASRPRMVICDNLGCLTDPINTVLTDPQVLDSCYKSFRWITNQPHTLLVVVDWVWAMNGHNGFWMESGWREAVDHVDVFDHVYLGGGRDFAADMQGADENAGLGWGGVLNPDERNLMCVFDGDSIPVAVRRHGERFHTMGRVPRI